VAGVSFVPRFASARLGAVWAPRAASLAWVRSASVRSVRVVLLRHDVARSLTVPELAAIPANPAGIAVRTDNGYWTAGPRGTSSVCWEHGYDRPPADLLREVRRAGPAGSRTVTGRSSTDDVQLVHVDRRERAPPSLDESLQLVREVFVRTGMATPGIALSTRRSAPTRRRRRQLATASRPRCTRVSPSQFPDAADRVLRRPRYGDWNVKRSSSAT